MQKPGKSKQDYGTPKNFLDKALEILDIEDWDWDLAAHAGNAVAGARYYCEAENGLVQSWVKGIGWNWLNPPFGNIAPWVARAWDQWATRGARTAVLVPAGVGSNWWRDWVHGKARVLLLNGRITFTDTPINPKTGKPDPYPKDCALLLYGAGDGPGYSVWTWPKGLQGFDKA